MVSENSGRKPPGRQGASARLDAWIAQVFGDKGLPRNALHVAQALRQFLNRATLTAWPAVGTLAKIAGLSVRTVQRLLRAMKGAGHLSIEDNAARFGCNLFGARLLPETEAALAKPAADRRPEVELHPAELSLNPRRENGSRADRPGRETAPASGPAPPGFARDRVRVETKSPLWEVVAGLYRREVNRLGPPLVNFGWRFSRDMVERAEAILATTG